MVEFLLPLAGKYRYFVVCGLHLQKSSSLSQSDLIVRWNAVQGDLNHCQGKHGQHLAGRMGA